MRWQYKMHVYHLSKLVDFRNRNSARFFKGHPVYDRTMSDSTTTANTRPLDALLARKIYILINATDSLKNIAARL